MNQTRHAADAAAALTRWIGLRQTLDRVPGIQVAVLAGDELVVDRAFGVADLTTGEELTTGHRFRIASHSKTFTATALMLLAERGEVRLDDRVSDHVTELASTPIGAATLRELLAHGGGIIRDGHDGGHWLLDQPFPDRARLVELATDGADVYGRNERFKYSNIGYSVLGAVIEAATGDPYAAVADRLLLEPLGLAATSAELEGEDPAAPLATGHSALVHGVRLPIDHVPTAAMAAATGFVSTASDVVRWAAAHFAGDERLLTDESKRIMQRTEWKVIGSAGLEYALGWMVTTINGRRLLGHGGGFPGHITHTLFDPAGELAVSVLTNAIDGPAQNYAANFFRLLDLAERSDEHAAVERTEADLTAYTGRFATLWGVYDIVELGGRLYQLDPTVADPTADPIELDVVDDDTLTIVAAPGFASPGEQVRYERRPDGTIVSVRGGTGARAVPLDEFLRRRHDQMRVSLPDA